MSFDPAWEAEHASRPWGQWPSEHLVRFVVRNYPKPASFLELGCGAGAQVAMLVAAGHTVTGIDGSETALMRAAERMGREFGVNVAVSWAVQDVTTYQATAATFDCVVDVATLQHLSDEDAVAVLDRAYGWLKPGGRFFSLHTAHEADYGLVSGNGAVHVRRAGRSEILHLFHRFDVDLGHEVVDRPNGGRVAHWIVEAQKP